MNLKLYALKAAGHLPTLLLTGMIWWTYSHPKAPEVVGCPCKATPPPEWKVTEQVVAGETEEIAWKKDVIGDGGKTCVRLHNGTMILLDGIVSMETRKTAYLQYWTAVPPATGSKRALVVTGQPTSHWIVE